MSSDKSPPTRRAMITGITGQDGILLARALLARKYEVVGFGRRDSILARAPLRSMFDSLAFAYGDMADPVAIADAIQHHKPEEIYNLASQSDPAKSWSMSAETGEITAMGAHRLFEAVRRFRPECRVYQASSSEMYGEVLASPQSESTPFNPANPYAVAKAYAHYIANVYRRGYGMFISCGILFNHESTLRGIRFVCQKVAYAAACSKLGITESTAMNEEGEPVVRGGKVSLGNLDARRDWGRAEDYVDAMWRILQQSKPDDFVIGTGQARTVRELCEVAYQHAGRDWRDHVVSDPRFMRPAETGPTVADASKARRELGWSPTITFEAMIAEMVDAHVAALSREHRDR